VICSPFVALLRHAHPCGRGRGDHSFSTACPSRVCFGPTHPLARDPPVREEPPCKRNRIVNVDKAD
jgi:hypothetical protein